jgi:hypothetical protein
VVFDVFGSFQVLSILLSGEEGTSKSYRGAVEHELPEEEAFRISCE